MNVKRVCIFGGTFDPFHLGHLNVAQHIFDKMNFDCLYLMPNFIPSHKNNASASAFHRLEMLKLVQKNNPHFSILTDEIQAKEVSYTWKTLTNLRKTPLFKNVNLFFLIGMDSLIKFHTWVYPEKILNLTNIIAVARPNYSLTDLPQETKDHIIHPQDYNNESSGKILIIETPTYDISSTQIRKDPQNCKNLLPKYIFDYISKNSLYS